VIIWLDQLYDGAIAAMATQSSLFRTMVTLVIIVGHYFLTGN